MGKLGKSRLGESRLGSPHDQRRRFSTPGTGSETSARPTAPPSGRGAVATSPEETSTTTNRSSVRGARPDGEVETDAIDT